MSNVNKSIKELYEPEKIEWAIPSEEEGFPSKEKKKETLNEKTEERWKRIPRDSSLELLHPDMRYLTSSRVRRAVEGDHRSSFSDGIAGTFFPAGKDSEQANEDFRNAMNRGINALNRLCAKFLPGYYRHLEMPEVKKPFDSFAFISQAREDLIKAKSGKRPSTRDHNLMFKAHNAMKSFGLGYLVLSMDTCPQFNQSIAYLNPIKRWMDEKFKFREPEDSGVVPIGDWISEDPIVYSWENESGSIILGTSKDPFRHRAKLFDENGKTIYGSALMKMFLNGEYPSQLIDSNGVELLVETEDKIGTVVDFFRRNLRLIGTLENYQQLRKSEYPPFTADKFVARIPVEIEEGGRSRTDRIPVEFQIRPLDKGYVHEAYKQGKFREVFPMWYPREIYEPILREKLG